MFITKASRHDKADIEEFLTKEGSWQGADVSRGTAFIAREGAIVGHARLIELTPTMLAVEQVLVREDKRRQGVGRRVMEAAMNNKGGKLFAACGEEHVPFFEKLGFSSVAFDDLPSEVREHHGSNDDRIYMTAR